ncbi:MAG: DUF488 family protein [Chloroflexota bacterium]|nr:DUF488 family protein [Chloroflexota bacterium]
MPIHSKNIYEPAGPEDGLRVLTTNYWPRGISKERAGTYMRALGPSRDLLRAFKDGQISWEQYEVRYLEEMRADKQQSEIRRLADLSRNETVTVMCMCKDEAQCHRRLLRDLIEAEMAVRA